MPVWELPNVDTRMLEDLREGVVSTLNNLDRMNTVALRRFDIAQNTAARTGESQIILNEMSQDCARYQNEAVMARQAAMEAYT